jgi:L-lactate dehydrogenase complex protein LldG
MNRDVFLARVREAAALGNHHRVQPQPIDAAAGYVGGGTDCCATLRAEIIAVGGRCQVVHNFDEARQVLIGYLGDLRPRKAICWQHRLLDELQLPHLLDYARISWHDAQRLAPLSPAEQQRTMLAADIGLSSCDFAVAESGTLALCSQAGQERMVSLLPPVHVAVVAESQILPDLFDLFEKLGSRSFDDWPSNLALITGPSKTGDIELQLTTGVHGPGDWRVIVIRGE